MERRTLPQQDAHVRLRVDSDAHFNEHCVPVLIEGYNRMVVLDGADDVLRVFGPLDELVAKCRWEYRFKFAGIRMPANASPHVAGEPDIRWAER